MASGYLNCVDAGKEVFFLVLQTVSLSGPCFNVIAWIHLYSPLICHKVNTIATQCIKPYNTKLINKALGGMLHG